MNGYLYRYATLRFIPDTVTQEFINIGVAIYSQEARYFKTRLNSRYSRISGIFHGLDGNHYHRVIGALERSAEQLQQRWQQNDWTNQPPDDITLALAQLLPPDDSSLLFVVGGGGFSENLDKELDELYMRLVTKHETDEESERRDDDQIWQIYQRALEPFEVLPKLGPVTINAPTFSYNFTRAWKNERWHPVEPVSLDLARPTSIANKASKWIGHSLKLHKNSELGTLYLLLGAPSDPKLMNEYHKAVTSLRELTKDTEIIEEERASEFSAKLAQIIEEHSVA